VDAKDPRTALVREHVGGDRREHAIADVAAGDAAEEGLARGADDHRSPQRGELTEPAQELQVVIDRLAEPDPRVEHDSLLSDALADREGHSLLVGEYSCRADSGPLSGGVWTATDIWEFNGTNAVLVTGYGVIRKPGATAVYRDTEGRLALTMTDGKVTGLTASGRGHWRLATGGSASLAGKSYTFAAKSAGPGRFAVEIKY